MITCGLNSFKNWYKLLIPFIPLWSYLYQFLLIFDDAVHYTVSQKACVHVSPNVPHSDVMPGVAISLLSVLACIYIVYKCYG